MVSVASGSAGSLCFICSLGYGDDEERHTGDMTKGGHKESRGGPQAGSVFILLVVVACVWAGSVSWSWRL